MAENDDMLSPATLLLIGQNIDFLRFFAHRGRGCAAPRCATDLKTWNVVQQYRFKRPSRKMNEMPIAL